MSRIARHRSRTGAIKFKLPFITIKMAVRYDENDDKPKTTAFDVLGKLAYKDLTLSTAVMLMEASLGHAADRYLTAAYRYALPQNFMLNTSVGASIDKSSHDDSRIETKSDGAFKEVRIGLSKEIANTGATASVDYGMGGKDHFDTDFDHQGFGL